MGGKPLTGIPRLIALGVVGGLLGGLAEMFGNPLSIEARPTLFMATSPSSISSSTMAALQGC